MRVYEQPDFQDWVDSISLSPWAVTGLIGQPSSGRTSLLYQLAFELCRREHQVLFVATEGNNMAQITLAQLAEVRLYRLESLRVDAAWRGGMDAEIAKLHKRLRVINPLTERGELERHLAGEPTAVLLVDNLNGLSALGSDRAAKMAALGELCARFFVPAVFTHFIKRPYDFEEDEQHMDERLRAIAHYGFSVDDVWLVSRNEDVQGRLDLSVSNGQQRHAISVGLEVADG